MKWLVWKRLPALLLTTLFISACQTVKEAPLDSYRLKIDIAQDGIVQLLLTDLQAAGLTINQLDVSQLRLSDQGSTIPYVINNNALIFYGQASANRYTPIRTYLLEVGQPGIEMAKTAVSAHKPITSFQQTIHLENDSIYESRARSAKNDTVWFWHTIQTGDALTIDAQLPAEISRDGRVTMQLHGLSSNPDHTQDHDLTLVVNGQVMGDIRWDGTAAQQATFAVTNLQSGQNQITFNNPSQPENPVDVMLLDWVEVQVETAVPPTAAPFQVSTSGQLSLSGETNQQPLLFNIANPTQPQLLTNWRAEQAMTLLTVQPDALRSPARLHLARKPSWTNSGADFVIITTEALKTAVQPLKAHRDSTGLRTLIVPFAEIADSFGYGSATPNAIRAFLAAAQADWTIPPRYVLLVGDGTTDFYENLVPLPEQHVPGFMVPVTYGGETISDARLADADNDGLPDVALGRWPVNSPAAVRALVKRTLSYESGLPVGSGSLIIDPADPAFTRMAERLLENGRIQTLAPVQDPKAAFAQTDSWMAAYIGHGSLGQWGQNALLHQDQLPTRLPPILLQFTCLTGLFAHPTQASLSEMMLTTSEGPVLTVAATSLTVSHHQEPFAEALLAALADTAVLRMGDAFLRGQRALDIQTTPELQEIVDTFVLLGDPTTRIMRPEP